MIGRVVLLALLLSAEAQATTYFVATTGSDSNNGLTSATAWRNPQKCVAAGSPLVAGDTCLVSAGSYTDPDGDGITIYATGSTSPAGTSAQPITLKSETPLGAIIQIPVTTLTGKRGINIQRPYYIIDGFQVTGGGGAESAIDMSMTGILLGSGATGAVIRRNAVHDIGRNLCSNSASSFAGMSIQGPNNVVLEYNKFYTIGRKRNGEGGCVTARYQHDHGLYILQSSNLTIRRNEFYDVNRGYPIQFYKSGGTTQIGVFLYGNVFSGAAPNGQPAGQILLCSTLNNVQIKNNIFNNPPLGYAIQYCAAGTTNTNVVFDHNLTNGTLSNFINPSPATTGYTYTNNLTNTNPGFLSTVPGSEDFSLPAGVSPIDAGVNIGESWCGSAPDIGVYETCGPQIASISGQTLEVTFGSVFPPVQVPNATGWSISCSGAGCGSAAVGSATLKSGADSIVSLNITGLPGNTCSSGDTYTVTYNASSGSVSDSIRVAYTSNQDMFSFTSFAVTNNCSGSPPSGPSGPIAYYKLEGNVNDSSGNGTTGTQNGGSFVEAKYGQGFKTTNGISESFTAGYGNGVNIGSQSVTIEMPVFVNTSDVGLTRNYMGTIEGTSQRLYILSIAGTWRVVVQSDGASATASDLPVTAGWNHIVLTLNSSTKTATLCKNGVTGTTGGAVKVYTSHTLPSNINFGNPGGFSTTSAPTAIYDEVKIWNSVQSCATAWTAWEPPAVTVGVQEQKAHRFQSVYLQNGVPVNLGTANNQSQQVIRSGGVAIVFQVDCQNIASCTAASYQLRYSLDGTNFNQVVPNTPTSDGVYMWGESADQRLNRFTATCPLTGALSCLSGDTTTVMSQSTTAKDLEQNSSYTLRFIVRVDTPPSPNVYFKLYDSKGNALGGGYTPSTGAQVVVVPPQASAH